MEQDIWNIKLSLKKRASPAPLLSSLLQDQSSSKGLRVFVPDFEIAQEHSFLVRVRVGNEWR